MSNREKQKRLKQTMALLKIKIENLKPHVESSDRINSMYNKMLIEKADLEENTVDDVLRILKAEFE